MSLNSKRILLGVTGSIAAYKAADICSRLGKLDADVHVVLTANAAQFVGAPTFRALTRNPVLQDVFDEPDSQRIAHIDLAQSADLVLVAPASANLMAKLAHGIADDLLTTCLLATPAATPLLVAPAMNTVMWEHPATVANVRTLIDRKVQFVEPATGLLACLDVGQGKLAEVDDIVRAVLSNLDRTNELEGQEYLVTAGATREPLDPVRFLSNRSSGRMGFAVAEEALRRGASVTLVSGPTGIAPPRGARLIRIETAAQMLDACLENAARCDVFVGAAAVADYTPQTVASQKIKKDNSDADSNALILRLCRTDDILATIGLRKRPEQIIVGFAAETEHLIGHARRKLKEKNADLIVANDVTMEGAGFDVETNVVTLVRQKGERSLPLMPKREVAEHIVEEIQRIRSERSSTSKAGLK